MTQSGIIWFILLVLLLLGICILGFYCYFCCADQDRHWVVAAEPKESQHQNEPLTPTTPNSGMNDSWKCKVLGGDVMHNVGRDTRGDEGFGNFTETDRLSVLVLGKSYNDHAVARSEPVVTVLTQVLQKQ